MPGSVASVGIVANQRRAGPNKKAGIQMGGVIYSDSADKAAGSSWIAIRRICRSFFSRTSADSWSARCGRERDHPQRREAGKRGQQFRRAEDHGHRWRIVRRRQLRHVRQSIRSAIHPRLAHGALRRDGRRAGVGHGVFDSRQSARTRR